MNIDNIIVQSTLFAQAADRLYKVAYLLPPTENAPKNQAFSIKLPVPTVISNAKVMSEIIQITPTSHRTPFMGQLYPLLQYLITVWEKMHQFTTLNMLQTKQPEIHALRQVTMLLHAIYPTVGVPGERVMHNGFSLGMSSDPMVMEKSLLLTKGLKKIAQNNATSLRRIAEKYDLALAENLNRLDPFATWDMANPDVYANEPKLCFIPCHMENLQNPRFSLAGNSRTIGKPNKSSVVHN